ncbi:SulP family inorganic anion transporter [Dyadobacter sp. CY345]|uniref:SulP family inorganic anion transporter n=1 Tax=Dyadobacter sp. CY345 TaxID=2909335 RepID=UPI001EEBB1C5|nr:SulP family inorganic anion transporter [Dyadobacter sp. CY345]MCF2444596.1 SulP family inorganic anion transporter [Dyadobacter sp. CY345]
MRSASWKPAAGFKGFLENWKDDLLSGFLVSLIALPLSLGIAGASNFPPLMGVLTSIVGGILVSFFTNSELTIKGPAAGLIVVSAGAVDELGRGDAVAGWHLALTAIVVAGVFQIILGIFKLPRFVDFFPLSVIHGVLAAIGIIIMSKQIHLAVGVAPVELSGKGPLELIEMVPHSLMNMEYHIGIIGLVGLMIMFGWRYLSFSIFKRIPPAMAVLIVSICLGRLFHLFEPTFREFRPLINPGEFSLKYNADFSGVTGNLFPVFIKYVIMFVLFGSLESSLTIRAIDLLDPYKRKSDPSRDVVAIGAGNIVSGLLGGLPMISEILRSAANVKNGGKTRWANLFHGVFLLVFVVLLVPVIKMVPVAALATMLIYIGFRLASPSEFQDIYHIGKEQLIIFLVTIIATLGSDLLIGILCGTLTNVIIQFCYGVKFSNIFTPKIEIEALGNTFYIKVLRAAVFTNYLTLKRTLERLPKGENIIVDLSEATYVDHTVMENITRFKCNYEQIGGKIELIGFENYQALSDHPLAARKNQCLTVIG